jgi:hypothetical protein
LGTFGIELEKRLKAFEGKPQGPKAQRTKKV